MGDSLARKLAAIAGECAYVQKTGRNDFHKYRYATAADVLAKVNEAMLKHGVCSTADAEILSEHDNAGNRTVTAKVTLTLHDGDSDQTLTTAGIGCGQDKGDKAVMKAQTAAIKYAWMLALNISTGDDPEADEDTDKRAVKPQPKVSSPPVQAVPRSHAEQSFAERTGAEPSMEGPAPTKPKPEAPKPAAPDLDDVDAQFEELASESAQPRLVDAAQPKSARFTDAVEAHKQAVAAGVRSAPPNPAFDDNAVELYVNAQQRAIRALAGRAR